MDMAQHPERIELRAIIASKQGLSCAGYYHLAARTAHLRERLYVSVSDGDKLFLPKYAFEHFPVAEIEEFYLGRLRLGLNESIGAGGGEALFACEGPAAEQGAMVISSTLAGLEPVLNQGLAGRVIASMPEKRRYLQYRFEMRRSYRPEVLPARVAAPADMPRSESERRRMRDARGPGERIEARTREILKRWGMESAYDDLLRMRRA